MNTMLEQEQQQQQQGDHVKGGGLSMLRVRSLVEEARLWLQQRWSVKPVRFALDSPLAPLEQCIKVEIVSLAS